MTPEQKRLDAKEFASLLLSCELAAQFNKDKPNKAIKNTLRHVEKRVTSPNIKLVAKQGLNQHFPLGWVKRQLNNVARHSGMTEEEFFKMGASL